MWCRVHNPRYGRDTVPVSVRNLIPPALWGGAVGTVLVTLLGGPMARPGRLGRTALALPEPSRQVNSDTSRSLQEPEAPEASDFRALAGRKIFVVYNTARWMYRFRLPLMKALQEQGCEVYGVSPWDRYADSLVEEGISHLPIEMNRKGTNPLEDAAFALRMHRLLREHRPDLVLAFTVKPNIYCALAARPLGIPVVNTIPGLGSLFARKSIPTLVARGLYRLALSGSHAVFFQNPEDLEQFVESRLVRPETARMVPGSGVNTEFFSPRERERGRDGDPFVFLFAGRLLWDKGISELVDATRELKERGIPVETRMLGVFEPEGNGAVSPEQMEEWARDGVIDFLGEADEVVDFMRAADCVVLPSYYREGLPRTLLEAASLEKPVIAADVTGSRELVEHGRNGFMCRPRDPKDLADKMHEMIRAGEDERRRMGRAGRERVLREFDEKVVVRRYLEVIAPALAG